jgi:hypothetical protein
MVSDLVLTERHLRGQLPTPEPVGMGSYNMDSHNVQRYVDAGGYARNEGDIQVNPGGPYPIGYRSIVPRKAECENLLVPVCVAASHIAYGSIRMEPVFLVLGQSAATAAALSLDRGVAVQDLPYEALESRLKADGQVIDLADSTAHRPSVALAVGALPGVVVDDEQAEFAGDWSPGRAIRPFVEDGYRHDGDAGKGEKSAVFRADLKPGRYEVRIAYPASDNRATNVPMVVRHAGGEARATVNQRERAGGEPGGAFRTLGVFRFDGAAAVEVRNDGTDGHVIVDAVQFLPAKD